MQPDAELRRVSSEQHGGVTREQAIACGVSVHRSQHRIEQGQYRWLGSGAYVVAGTPDTWHRRVSAAVFSTGLNAAASHETAAELLGLTTRRGAKIEVITPRWTREHRGFIVHESRDLIPADVVTVDGIPTTMAARTIVDLGASGPLWLIASCLDTGLRKAIVTLDEVDGVISRVAKRGRRGVGVVRPLVQERRQWVGRTESELEDAFKRLIITSGLPMPESQFEVVDRFGDFVSRADFAYPQARVLIELDGVAFHMDRETFQRDREKQNRAELLGWRVLRYTWQDVIERRQVVAPQLRSILA
jgi:very-short-patch-repair endonuclease